MKTFPVGTAVSVTVPLIDLNGDPLPAPTGISARVVDADGLVIVASHPLTYDPDPTEIEYAVAASANQAAGDSARFVELEVTTAAGVFVVTEGYLLRPNQRLEEPTNSFQTYNRALLTAGSLVGLVGWDAADAFSRQNALLIAYQRLTKIGYRILRPEDLDAQNVIVDTDHVIEPRFWPLMTAEKWATYPERFRDAIRRAQVAEANELLRGDRIGEKRRNGILSESIGESSMMFRSGKPLDLGISAEALRHVTGFIFTRVSTTRS